MSRKEENHGPRQRTESDDFLAGKGEMAALIRSTDWSRTPLGSVDGWPQSLRTTVSLCLASNFPINIIWGPEHIQIYNDGYQMICAEAHPSALGQNYSLTWASAWPAIGDPFERALTGETSYLENQRMFLTRNGYLEETFFTFSISPIRDESGGIGGLFHPVTETTTRMLSERRMRALRDLNAVLAVAADYQQIATLAAGSLAAFEFDLPFLLFYELAADDASYELTASHGIDPRSAAAPATLATHATSPWPLASALDARKPVSCEGIASSLSGGSYCGPYDEPPQAAFLLPVNVAGLNKPLAIIVAGVSPRLPLDDAYRGFYELLTAAVTAAAVTVRARKDERDRAEALAEIDRAKTAFFANVSHELRTPLTLILGPLEQSMALADQLPPDERERVVLAHRNGLRLLKLVNSLLDFSRIEAGRVQASFQPTDLAAYTAELASVFRSAIECAGLTLRFDVVPLHEAVNIDRDMWERIVLNLLSNAFKFTFKGEICVAVQPSADGQAAEVVVSDTGTGIASAELPRLFERFYRIEGSRGRSFEGSGLGLALVQELVKLHGGRIDVHSEPGTGSRFTISVPFGDAHLPADRMGSAQPLPTASRRGSAYSNEALSWLPARNDLPGALDPVPSAAVAGRVVLADDNADMRDYVARLLAAEGYEVEAVADGHKAFLAARRVLPDLILSDVMMPRLDGFGLVNALRDDPHLRDIPIILLSARAGEEARVDGLHAGADDYLVKPFSARELIARVASNIKLARVRRQAAEAVAHSEQRLRSMFETSYQYQLVLSPDGTLLDANGTSLAGIGADLSQVIGQPLWDTTWFSRTPDMADAMRADVNQVAGGQTVQRELLLDLPIDGWRTFECTLRPIRDECHQVTAIVMDAIDTTKRKKAEVALRQAQKIEAIGQLTGGVAHDFNNLLMVLSGGLGLLGQEIEPARRERILTHMRQAVERGAGLTRQLLTFARRQPLKPVSLDLGQHLEALREMLDRTLSGDVQVEARFPPDLWRSCADPAELELALLNICINARDAMPNGGKIVIHATNVPAGTMATRNMDCIQLRVIDTGTGMPPDVASKAFELFFTTKDVGKGSGLGLAQVYGFAQGSSGSVQIDSEVGRGTTVTLLLPRGDRVNTDLPIHAPTPLMAAQPGALRSVLLVEDDNEVAALVLELLEALGYEVTRVASAASALGALTNGRDIDLVFSDVMMPGGMNGIELAREIKRRHAGMPIVLTSGYADAVQEDAASENIALLPKPYNLQTLSAVLQATWQQRAKMA